MKMLLRSVQTGLYVGCDLDWTCEAVEAMDFKTMSRAIRFAEKAGFTRMELAFVSDSPSHPQPVSLKALKSRLSASDRLD
jgi:hypothetical protein